MSGYLARLVDRAAGPPAAAVSPRVGPVFPVRPPGPGVDPAVVAPRDGDDVQTSRAPGPALGRERAARPDGPPAPVPSRAPGAPTDAPSPVAGGPAVRSHAHGEDRPPAAVPPVAAERKPVEARAVPSVPPESDAVARVDIRAEQASTPRSEAPVTAAPVVALSRPAAPDVLRAPRPQGSGVPRERPPRIEVRIGRVEIRRPAPLEPVEWPAVAPAPAEQAAGGFGELAAARRYLDRRWS